MLTYERDPRIREAVRALGVETYLLKSECAAPEVVRSIDAKLMSFGVPGTAADGAG